jgi:hypothetical protein
MRAAERIKSACGASIDRGFLRLMEWVWEKNNSRSVRPISLDHRQALERYRIRDAQQFFPEPQAARPTLLQRRGELERICWRSAYRTWDRSYQQEFDAHLANSVVHAECSIIDARRPTVICLHPWMVGNFAIARHQFAALYPRFNVVQMILPFHGPRSDARLPGMSLWPGRCPRRTNEGFGQLIWDLRALLGYVRGRVDGVIGVVGMSLGGYGAALAAGIEKRLAFAVPVIPFINMPELMWWHGSHRQERLQAETDGLSLDEMRQLHAVHCPLSHRPVIARDGLMVVAGRADRICHPDQAMALWEHWRRPVLHLWSGGHAAQFGRKNAFAAITKLIAQFS